MSDNGMRFGPCAEPTPHLFIGNLFGSPFLTVDHLCCALGALNAPQPDASRSFLREGGASAILSFSTTAEAQSAREKALLNGLEGVENPTVRFSRPVGPRLEKKPVPRPRPAYTLAQVRAMQLANDPRVPKGLILEADVITSEQEHTLADFVDRSSWETLIKRRVQHYGMKFDYLSLKHQAVGDNCGVPSIFWTATDGLQRDTTESYDQLTVNEYFPGTGIAPHVETHSCFEEGFCSVSLLGGIVMDLRRKVFSDSDEEILEEEIFSVYLPPRSRISFWGEARYGWKHGIASRTSDCVRGEGNDERIVDRERRISLTFRTCKLSAEKQKCECAFPEVCDWQNPDSLKLPSRVLKQDNQVESLSGG